MVPTESRIRITVESEMLRTDPPIVIHHIQMKTDRAEWRETYGSNAEVEAFLRGAEAFCNMNGSYFGAHNIERIKIETASDIVRKGS